MVFTSKVKKTCWILLTFTRSCSRCESGVLLGHKINFKRIGHVGHPVSYDLPPIFLPPNNPPSCIHIPAPKLLAAACQPRRRVQGHPSGLWPTGSSLVTWGSYRRSYYGIHPFPPNTSGKPKFLAVYKLQMWGRFSATEAYYWKVTISPVIHATLNDISSIFTDFLAGISHQTSGSPPQRTSGLWQYLQRKISNSTRSWREILKKSTHLHRWQHKLHEKGHSQSAAQRISLRKANPTTRVDAGSGSGCRKK